MITIQKFHLYSLKVSGNVKISVECFENFRVGQMPQMPPPLVARLILANIILHHKSNFHRQHVILSAFYSFSPRLCETVQNFEVSTCLISHNTGHSVCGQTLSYHSSTKMSRPLLLKIYLFSTLVSHNVLNNGAHLQINHGMDILISIFCYR